MPIINTSANNSPNPVPSSICYPFHLTNKTLTATIVAQGADFCQPPSYNRTVHPCYRPTIRLVARLYAYSSPFRLRNRPVTEVDPFCV